MTPVAPRSLKRTCTPCASARRAQSADRRIIGCHM
ncbi:Uncharacterised protein [Mycobacteroides abscessus subsp. abscessus]|nr:Uncharacterised protein [Mycobacteroides abscessus subsp. abscessus]